MENILFITLSNIGDVILTLPVLDTLRERYPLSKITVICGKRPAKIFQDNPYIHRFIPYDKHSPLKEKIKLFNELKKEKFDIVVDLRNSLFGLLLPARRKTLPWRFLSNARMHMRDKHLNRIGDYKISNPKNLSLYIKVEDREYINTLLKIHNISPEDTIIVIAPGARSSVKIWPKERFLSLSMALIDEFNAKIFLVGDSADIFISEYIAERSGKRVIDITNKTTLTQLACLLKISRLVITNDSAVLHLASYLDVPTIGIFGPTDEIKYGPWSSIKMVVKKDIYCRPCESAQCRYNTRDCMQMIKVIDVLNAARNILVQVKQVSGSHHIELPVITNRYAFKRILIVRTDRIGDVLLSTPVIKALRDNFPGAYIAMMVSPYAQDVVRDNPYLDEVIIFDKDSRHKGLLRTYNFAMALKKKKFDAAIILHPTNRVHLVTFLAGIARRIGYDRKLGFLLTDRIKHTKQLGQRHELEYSLDLVRYLGIMPKDINPFMPIRQESEEIVEGLFKENGITPQDKVIAIHPGASCISKIWPLERFAEVSDKLVEKYGFKILIVAGQKDISLAHKVASIMKHNSINLAGKTSVSQLASVLKRCRLLISNDSGPVHIASALGTPVVAIFGRAQKGLSPLRWGPRGIKDRILHKDVGCIKCLAHNCTKEFLCLKAITVDEVLKAVDSICLETKELSS